MGVMLGGAAVFFGLEQRPRVAERRDERSASVAPVGAVGDEQRRAPGPSPLVAALAATRDTVVNLETARGRGAGVIVDGRGIVITNYHVIVDALQPQREGLFALLEPPRPADSRIVARFENDREVEAEVVVADREEDLAVLRLRLRDPNERFAAARLGHSADLDVGEDVFAIGNPFGLPHTVSRGIVSALDRTGIMENRQIGMIQLDASINLGNSGGPLFNLAGELVGIVTARQERAQGIAFALPVDHVRGFLRAVADPAAARSGMMGVVLDLQRELPEEVRALGYRAGVLVEAVHEGQAAAQAGLGPGDAVVAVRGKRFDGLLGSSTGEPPSAAVVATHLQRTVRSMFEGEKLPLTVIRDGAELQLQLEVGAASPREQAYIDADELLGVLVDIRANAPVVNGIRPDSSLARHAAALGGTTIVRLMGQEVEDIEGFGRALAELRELRRTRGTAPSVLLTFRDAERGEASLWARVK